MLVSHAYFTLFFSFNHFRPAFMDEYEKLEVELSTIYEVIHGKISVRVCMAYKFMIWPQYTYQ